MRPWQVIARREFQQLAGGRAYIVITIIVALLIGGLAFAPALIELLSSNGASGSEPARILVVAPESLFHELQGQSGPVAGAAPLDLEWLGPELDRTGQASADEMVRSGAADGLLELARQPGPEPLWVRVTLAGSNGRLFSALQQRVTPLVMAARAEILGLAPEALERLQRPAPVEARVLEVDPEGANRPDPIQTAIAQTLSYVLLFGLYMAIILYGNAISMGVIQEKGTRVVELLAGATTPTQILVGKVVGIGGAGLLQFVIWMLVGLLFSLPQAASGLAARFGLGALDLSVRAIPASTLLYFTFFFLLGYVLYALLYAAFASTAARAEEANQALMIPVFLVITAFLAAVVAWSVPDHRVAVVASLVPFFTPFALFTRIVLTSVPTWQVLLGVGLTLVTILLVLVFAARAYRRNILRFRRISLRELLTGRESEQRA